MIQDQDQDVQIIHSNNNNGEEFNKQQLDTITGGCVECAAVGFEAKAMAKDITKKIPLIADPSKRANFAHVGSSFNALSKKVKANADNELRGPCSSFLSNKSSLDRTYQLGNSIL